MTKETNRQTNNTLSFPIGTATDGRMITADFQHIPHILVAGAVASGKSVFLHALVCSLVREHSPEEVRFVLVDPKQVEFGGFEALPHLIGPIVKDTAQAEAALQWAVSETERRRKAIADAGCSGIDDFNARKADGKLAHIVIACDEYIDLLFEKGETIKPSVLRLAAEGGAAGIHLVMATSRPCGSRNFSEAILAAIPAHMVFKLVIGWDWRRLLGPSDEIVCEARALLKRPGDAIWLNPAGERVFVHGPFLPSTDVERIVGEAAAKYPETSEDGPWKGIRRREAAYEESRPGSAEDIEALYARAKQAVLESGLVSGYLLQRRLGIALSDALWLLALLEARHVIGPEREDGPREILREGE